MSNTLAQNPTMASYSGAASVSKLFSGSMTNPSLIVVTATTEDPASTIAVADDKNAGGYTQDSFGQGGIGAGAGTSGVYSKQNTQTAAATATATITGGNTSGTLKAYELTGAATSSALDTQNSGSGTASNNSVAITTGTANCTVVAVGTHYPSGVTADSNYTDAFAETGISNAYHYGEYRVDAGAAGAITLTFGLGLESAWSMAVAAYKTSGGGGGSVFNPYFYGQVAQH